MTQLEFPMTARVPATFDLALLAPGLALLIVLTGCGGSDEPKATSPATPAGPAAVAPVVTATSPAASDPMPTGVDTHTMVSASFSKLMMASSFTDPPTNFALFCPASTLVATSVSYDSASQTATLTPLQPLPAGTICQVTVNAAVLDDTRIALTSAYVWRFVTAAAN